MYRYPKIIVSFLFSLSFALVGFSRENTRFSIEGTVAYSAPGLRSFISEQASFSCNWLFMESELTDQLADDEYRNRYMRAFSDFYFSFDRHYVAIYAGELEGRKRSRIELENIPEDFGGDQIYMRIPLKSDSVDGWSSVLIEMWLMDEEGILLDSPNLPRELNELPRGAFRMHFVKNNDPEETATIEGELNSVEMVPAFLSDKEVVSAMESYILELADHVKKLEEKLDNETSRNSLLEFKIDRLNYEKEKLIVEVQSSLNDEVREELEAKVVQLEQERETIEKDQEILKEKVVKLTVEKEERDDSIKQLQLEKHALIQLIVDLKQEDPVAKDVSQELPKSAMRIIPSNDTETSTVFVESSVVQELSFEDEGLSFVDEVEGIIEVTTPEPTASALSVLEEVSEEVSIPKEIKEVKKSRRKSLRSRIRKR